MQIVGARSETIQALMKAIRSLTPRQRLAMAGRYFHGWTDRRMAAMWGISRTGVRMRRLRARRRLGQIPGAQFRKPKRGQRIRVGSISGIEMLIPA